MKTVKATIYEATDGTRFLDEAKCITYEAKLAADQPEKALGGLPPSAFLDAIAGRNKVVADAVEAVARKVANARYERGEFKQRRTKGGRPVLAEPPGEPAPGPAVAPGGLVELDPPMKHHLLVEPAGDGVLLTTSQSVAAE